MKNLLKIFMAALLLGASACNPASHPSKWSEQKLKEWFDSGQFLNGLQMIPDASIDLRTFAIHYYDNKVKWDKSFAFLKNTDLTKLALGRVEIGDGVYAAVSEYLPKDREGMLFEAHKKYIDIQYIIAGKELIDVAPLKNTTITKPYNADSDAMFGAVTGFSELRALPGRFFIFFPNDAHRPSMKYGDEDITVRKIVVKIPVGETK